MPRIRTIKPQFWLDENLGTISRDARLLYIGLWNLADDTGVFQWRPLQIKAQIFPYDTDITGSEIEDWINKLVETKDIERIEIDGHSYGVIKSFLEHQDIKNPSKWTFLGKERRTLPQPYHSTTPALPVGKEEKKRVIGKKESIYIPLEFKNVKITKEEYDTLLEKFGEKGTKDRIENLSLYMASKGDKYKSHYATILSWARRDEKGGQGGTTRQQPQQGRRNPIEIIKS